MRVAALLSIGYLLCFSDLPAGDSRKPILLYSTYFTAEGDNRYSAATTYKPVLEAMSANFEVRAHGEPLSKKTLSGVAVLLIANPDEKAVEGHPPPHHFSKQDISTLTGFVQGGGGLIVMGNQEKHNLEVEDTNKLLANFGLQFTNRYTDAKKLVIPKQTPIIGGLRWAYYTGNQVLFDPKHPGKARSLVDNDLAQKPEKGPRDEPGSLLGIAEPGRGRVILVTDAGWVASFALNEQGVGGVAIKGQDNLEIFRRLALWAAHKRQD